MKDIKENQGSPNDYRMVTGILIRRIAKDNDEIDIEKALRVA